MAPRTWPASQTETLWCALLSYLRRRLAYCAVACRRETGSVQLRSLVVLKYSSSPDAVDAGQLLSQLPEHLKAK